MEKSYIVCKLFIKILNFFLVCNCFTLSRYSQKHNYLLFSDFSKNFICRSRLINNVMLIAAVTAFLKKKTGPDAGCRSLCVFYNLQSIQRLGNFALGHFHTLGHVNAGTLENGGDMSQILGRCLECDLFISS